MKTSRDIITSSAERNPAEAADEKDRDDERVARLLERIEDHLARSQRGHLQHDFSILRLFGSLLQMFAIVVAIWGTLALLNEQSAPATARLTLACFLQLASISAFAIDRFR